MEEDTVSLGGEEEDAILPGGFLEGEVSLTRSSLDLIVCIFPWIFHNCAELNDSVHESIRNELIFFNGSNNFTARWRPLTFITEGSG